jgi:hypothetical protein
MATNSDTSQRLSRRTLVGSGLAGAALLPLDPALRARVAATQFPVQAGAPMAAAATPAGWRTWYLTSPSELRPPNPGPPTPAEIAELVAFRASSRPHRRKRSRSGARARPSSPGRRCCPAW